MISLIFAFAVRTEFEPENFSFSFRIMFLAVAIYHNNNSVSQQQVLMLHIFPVRFGGLTLSEVTILKFLHTWFNIESKIITIIHTSFI